MKRGEGVHLKEATMPSDITERLRNVLSNEDGTYDEAPLGLCEEAAKEIERLRSVGQEGIRRAVAVGVDDAAYLRRELAEANALLAEYGTWEVGKDSNGHPDTRQWSRQYDGWAKRVADHLTKYKESTDGRYSGQQT
jgi:hypothetical protein